MTEESSTNSPYLSVAMTTAGTTQIMTSSWSRGMEFYFKCAVIIIGAFGTAANGLILYALVASKQHKKNVLIVNQNILDVFTCLFLITIYSLKLCNIYLTGTTGYWLCITVLSECLWTFTATGSIINLAIITVDRYLKVVHPVWSKTKLQDWIIYSLAAFSWISSLVYNLALVFPTTTVMDGMCYAYAIWPNETTMIITSVYSVTSSYFFILLIFIFCYWRILVVIRRQASVMAAHSSPGSSAAQAQSHHIQSSVIKTMFLVCAGYAIMWLPYNIGTLYINVSPNLLNTGYYYASLFLAFLYICINPFIYAAKFDPVKQVLLRMIPCKKIAGQANDSGNTGPRVVTVRGIHASN